MTTVQLDKKSYSIKDTLLVKEYSRLMDRLQFVIDFQEKIKNATPEEQVKLSNEINQVTSEDWKFMRDVVKRCYGLTNKDVDELHNIDMLYLFSEVRNESAILKKK